MKKAILPIFLFIYIVIDTILKQKGVEFCSSTGCKMAGQLLKFDSLYLNYLGAFGAFVLAILAFLKANRLFTWLSVTMVIFESLLIASQLNLNPEVCKFCLGVYVFLWLILITANKKVALYTIAPAIAVFVAFSILAVPKNITLIKKDGLYLIASKSCPHCIKTREALDKSGVKYSVISSTNINAIYFAKSLNISHIPIAIEKKGSHITITVGDSDIIKKYTNQDILKNDKSSLSNQPSTPLTPTLNFNPQDEGCQLSIQEVSCDSK